MPATAVDGTVADCLPSGVVALRLTDGLTVPNCCVSWKLVPIAAATPCNWYSIRQFPALHGCVMLMSV